MNPNRCGRFGYSLAFTMLLCSVSRSAGATPIFSTCLDCDGSKYAITWSLESDNGIQSVYDLTLWADTRGNTLGASGLNAVAVGFNLGSGGSVGMAMDLAPNGAANWTGKGGGLSNAGCNGTGAFICSSSNGPAFDATMPSTTIYQWTWDITEPDGFVFPTSGDLKVHYDNMNGHLVSDNFAFQPRTTPPPPLAPVPEPASLALVGSGLALLARRLRVKK